MPARNLLLCARRSTPCLPRCPQRSSATCLQPTMTDAARESRGCLPAAKYQSKVPPSPGAVPRSRPTYCSTPCLLPRYQPKAILQGPAAGLPYHACPTLCTPPPPHLRPTRSHLPGAMSWSRFSSNTPIYLLHYALLAAEGCPRYRQTASLLSKTTRAGGHAEVKEHLPPEYQPASTCSIPYALCPAGLMIQRSYVP